MLRRGLKSDDSALFSKGHISQMIPDLSDHAARKLRQVGGYEHKEGVGVLLRIVEKGFAQVSLHCVCKVVAVACFGDMEVFLRAFDDLVPVLLIDFNIKAYDLVILENGPSPGLSVILVVWSPYGINGQAYQHRCGYGFHPGPAAAECKQDKRKIDEDSDCVAGNVEVFGLAEEGPYKECGSDCQ